MTKIKIDTWYTNQSIGSRGYCEWVADSQSKWGFCFAVLGFKLANIHDNVQTWKNCNYWWIYEVKKSVLRLLRLALRKILLVYENKRELAWWLPYLLRWKQNTHWKVWLLKLVDIWFRSGEIDHLSTVMATYVFLSLWEGKEKRNKFTVVYCFCIIIVQNDL